MPYNMTAWIFGTGPMGEEYAKILHALGFSFQVIGRGESSAASFRKNTGFEAIAGGTQKFLKNNPVMPNMAIVAVSANQLSYVAEQLLDYGLKKILLEKPGAMNIEQLQSIARKSKKSEIYIGYNRRYFSSVLKAKEIIDSDGGIRSFHFDFTEWPSRILSYEQPDGALENWFFLNSTHVVDLAFFLGGWPIEIHSQTSGKLDWHTPSAFSGSGKTDKGAIFSYKANWESAGRWSVELMTTKRKLIFAPMEKLQEQRLNDINIYEIAVDDTYDAAHKPGLYKQVTDFISPTPQLLRLEDQLNNWKIYNKIAGKLS